ncbi:MAG: DUF4271 domain-containing protein [Tannerella sp.]|jgi:hypothetical protein|nr:DUF4271 domain-containing protein [Tannerella sp.]
MEGFEGISINTESVSNDTLLVFVLVLLSIFAVVFRQNASLLGKMFSDIGSKEQKDNMFDTADKENFLFNGFMNFQSVALLGIYVFAWAVKTGYFVMPDTKTTLLTVSVLMLIFFIFYLLRKMIYSGLLYIFAESADYSFLRIYYRSMFQLWGVFLYIPVLWILLVEDYILFSIILLIISYLIVRIILTFRFIYIFFGKNIWFLFLSLYLCTQEIVPLVFLYKGLIYLYNIIGNSNIWQ